MITSLNEKTEIAKLLWTGGWDSTFRLCDLVLIKKARVQPFYIIDIERKSFTVEIRTMYKIKSLLIRKDKTVEDKILPILFFSKEDIKENNLITNKFLNLRKKVHLGGQYDWLARFAEQLNISELEMCIESDPGRRGIVTFLGESKMVAEGKDNFGAYFKLVKQLDDDDISLLKYFKFPTFSLDKNTMHDIAKKEGFLDIMHETWFCHKPTKALKPCGMCHPCLITIQVGMSYRFSKTALLKASIKRVEKKILSSQNKTVVPLVDLARSVRNGWKRAIRGKANVNG